MRKTVLYDVGASRVELHRAIQLRNFIAIDAPVPSGTHPTGFRIRGSFFVPWLNGKHPADSTYLWRLGAFCVMVGCWLRLFQWKALALGHKNKLWPTVTSNTPSRCGPLSRAPIYATYFGRESDFGDLPRRIPAPPRTARNRRRFYFALWCGSTIFAQRNLLQASCASRSGPLNSSPLLGSVGHYARWVRAGYGAVPETLSAIRVVRSIIINICIYICD